MCKGLSVTVELGDEVIAGWSLSLGTRKWFIYLARSSGSSWGWGGTNNIRHALAPPNPVTITEGNFPGNSLKLNVHLATSHR